ncbi:Hypothetical predicted protein [Podarcis lilfordi]|uniref:Uncharacterized protein n=1 Tax=Podarcis lilfordi TaxID=74358 RepID=A0AA35PBL1_9SAUR|nr:Hypothetical predicted protein [Podarcis lilfordi]
MCRSETRVTIYVFQGLLPCENIYLPSSLRFCLEDTLAFLFFSPEHLSTTWGSTQGGEGYKRLNRQQQQQQQQQQLSSGLQVSLSALCSPRPGFFINSAKSILLICYSLRLPGSIKHPFFAAIGFEI